MSAAKFSFEKLLVAALMVLVFIAFLALSNAVFAADATVTWANPTSNTDGTTIPATGAGSLTATRVEYGSCSAPNVFGTRAGEVSVPAPATTTTISGFAPNTTSCFRAFARNTYGQESAVSNIASKFFPAPIPNPPIIAIAVVAGMQQTPVYSITAAGKISTLMGFVDVGTACNGPALVTYRSRAFHEVARSDVKWWGSTSLRVAAPCGAQG